MDEPGSATPGRSDQKAGVTRRSTTMSTTPVSAMPMPMTSGGPSPNQETPL